jgi:hypothetical protein
MAAGRAAALAPRPQARWPHPSTVAVCGQRLDIPRRQPLARASGFPAFPMGVVGSGCAQNLRRRPPPTCRPQLAALSLPPSACRPQRHTFRGYLLLLGWPTRAGRQDRRSPGTLSKPGRSCCVREGLPRSVRSQSAERQLRKWALARPWAPSTPVAAVSVVGRPARNPNVSRCPEDAGNLRNPCNRAFPADSAHPGGCLLARAVSGWVCRGSWPGRGLQPRPRQLVVGF